MCVSNELGRGSQLRRGRTAQRGVQEPWVGGIERRMNWAERETGNGGQKVGKGRRGRSEKQRGEGGVYVR
jgi:hypothetical protein